MKRWLILLALISTPVFSAENWDRTQLNLKLQKNDWSIKYREYVAGLDSDGEVDKFHWQMSYKYDNWRFDYQYWEKNGKVELRPRFQVKLFKQENGFYFRPRVEYRDRRGKEEYFRLWTTLGWDGNYNGEKSQQDVYTYRVLFSDSYGEQSQFGFVTLIR